MTWRDHRGWLLGLAVSTAYWPGMLSPAFGPRWAALAVGVPLAFSIDPRELPEPIRWLLAFLFAIATASVFISPDQPSALYELMQIAIVAAAFVAAAGRTSIDDVMAGLAAGLAASSALLVYNYGDKPVGLFLNSEVLAEFAALITVWAVVQKRYITAASTLVPLALCHSRIALLTVAVGLVFAYWPRSTRARAAVITAIVAVAAELLFASAYKAGSADHRLILWGTAAVALFHAPFGSGLGWFQAAQPESMFAHSDVLQMLVELGIGAIAIVLIPIVALRKGRGTNAERAVLVAVCFQAVVSFPLHMPASAFVAALVAGRLVGRRAVVRMGEPVGRVADDADQRRQAAPDREYPVRSGRGSGAVSVRSSAENTQAVYPQPHRLYPKGA